MRVNTDHWNVLLDFAEKHPSIITNKFQGVHGKQNQNQLWDELTNKLNSLGYGEKTVKEWKKTLIDWKSKVKAKAGGIKTYENQTGGGPPCYEQMSSVENRLLCIMGKSSYEGNPGNMKVGLRKRRLSDNQLGQDNPLVHRNKEGGNERINIIQDQVLKQPNRTTATVVPGISPIALSRSFHQTSVAPKLILVNQNKGHYLYPHQSPATFTKYDQAMDTSSQKFLNEDTQNKNNNSYNILKNMKLPVTKISSSSATPECSLQDKDKKTEITVGQSSSSQNKFNKTKSTDAMLSMHNDIVNILEKINNNLESLASTSVSLLILVYEH